MSFKDIPVNVTCAFFSACTGMYCAYDFNLYIGRMFRIQHKQPT